MFHGVPQANSLFHHNQGKCICNCVGVWIDRTGFSHLEGPGHRVGSDLWQDSPSAPLGSLESLDDVELSWLPFTSWVISSCVVEGIKLMEHLKKKNTNICCYALNYDFTT